MHDFTPLSSLLGGALIGVAASLFLWTHGRVAGISGIYAGALRRGTTDRRARILFLLGLVLAAVVVRMARPEAFASSWTASLPVALFAGVLVGVGTQLGNGCTSGHGVCGLSRLSRRSFVATLTFMATAAVTVFVVRHVIGGTP
jgi:uncharacterized membrane protein YedE/YeeE